MTIRKFEGHEQANARIMENGKGGRKLISYTTIVCELNEEGWLTVYGLYSMTTIKHIGWFMREIGFDYQLAKQLYNDNKMFNIFTGEVIDRV